MAGEGDEAGEAVDLVDGLLYFSRDAVVTVDQVGTIVYASPSVDPIFGYDRNELVGTTLDAFVHT